MSARASTSIRSSIVAGTGSSCAAMPWVEDLLQASRVAVGDAHRATVEDDRLPGRVEGGEGARPVVGVHGDRGRVADDVVLAAVGDEGAVGHQEKPVALLGLLHVVRGHQDPDAGVGSAPDGVPQPGPGEGIDAGRGLVEQQHLGRVAQGRDERHPPLGAQGQVTDQDVGIGM